MRIIKRNPEVTGETPGTRTSPRVPGFTRAQQAAIENFRRPYRELKCGHFTDYETMLLYSVFGRETEFFCENCSEWRKLKPEPPPPVYPEEPMF